MPHGIVIRISSDRLPAEHDGLKISIFIDVLVNERGPFDDANRNVNADLL